MWPFCLTWDTSTHRNSPQRAWQNLQASFGDFSGTTPRRRRLAGGLASRAAIADEGQRLRRLMKCLQLRNWAATWDWFIYYTFIAVWLVYHSSIWLGCSWAKVTQRTFNTFPSPSKETLLSWWQTRFQWAMHAKVWKSCMELRKLSKPIAHMCGLNESRRSKQAKGSRSIALKRNQWNTYLAQKGWKGGSHKYHNFNMCKVQSHGFGTLEVLPSISKQLSLDSCINAKIVNISNTGNEVIGKKGFLNNWGQNYPHSTSPTHVPFCLCLTLPNEL